MKFGLSKTAIAISSPSPGHLKTQRKKLEKPKENTGYGLSGRKNDPHACAAYQDKALRNLPCKRVQMDEIWSFVYAKNNNLKDAEAAPATAGRSPWRTAVGDQVRAAGCSLSVYDPR
jgi:hypothetical protein